MNVKDGLRSAGHLKKFYLKYIVRYNNPKKYWDERWRVRLDNKNEIEYRKKIFDAISHVLLRNGCNNVLEIGCGQAWLRGLPNYLGLDFSIKVLKQNGLNEFLYADITRRIPLPDKSFDAVISLAVLMHISPQDIEKAIAEISRAAKKCVILQESLAQSNQPHCFSHDYERLFKKYFDGNLVFLNE